MRVTIALCGDANAVVEHVKGGVRVWAPRINAGGVRLTGLFATHADVSRVQGDFYSPTYAPLFDLIRYMLRNRG